jgi:putative tryptophan/tyrosine transport system substrate-binding protein
MRPSATSGPYRNLRVILATKPAELPVVAPMKFELVINLKTAKQIGLTIPQSLLYRVDKVIR